MAWKNSSPMGFPEVTRPEFLSKFRGKRGRERERGRESSRSIHCTKMDPLAPQTSALWVSLEFLGTRPKSMENYFSQVCHPDPIENGESCGAKRSHNKVAALLTSILSEDLATKTPAESP